MFTRMRVREYVYGREMCREKTKVGEPNQKIGNQGWKPGAGRLGRLERWTDENGLRRGESRGKKGRRRKTGK